MPFGSEGSMTFAGDEAEAPWRSMMNSGLPKKHIV